MNRSLNRSVSRSYSAAFARAALLKTSKSPVPAPVPLSPGPFFSPGFTRPRVRWDSNDEDMPRGDHLVSTAPDIEYPPEAHISHTVPLPQVARFSEYKRLSGLRRVMYFIFPVIHWASVQRRVPGGGAAFG